MEDMSRSPWPPPSSAAEFLHRASQVLESATGQGGIVPESIGSVHLHPHQQHGARRLHALLELHGGALLADEVGLGKTFTALAVAARYPDALIVSPASLVTMWRDACLRAGVTATHLSYEYLSARSDLAALPHSPSLVILDEAHYARSPATRRYRALAKLTRGARVLLLTATPLHNRRGDVDALFALFAGASSRELSQVTSGAPIVRRTANQVNLTLPRIRGPVVHEVPVAPEVLEALRAIPPPMPPQGGGVAHALVALQLTRAWCSSDAALLAAIRRRLAVAAALEHALGEGTHPSRRDLTLWTAANDGSVQLALSPLLSSRATSRACQEMLDIVAEHARALRLLRDLVLGRLARDPLRFAAVRQIVSRGHGPPTVAFTHSVDTGLALHVALRGVTRTAVLSGRGAQIASGSITRRELLSLFDPSAAPRGRQPSRETDPLAVDLLVATDVLSEGVNLQRAATLVHLDLPWTMARLEQRMGRIRRLASPHAEVDMHLVSPPADANEVLATLTHLAFKAGLARDFLGSPSLQSVFPSLDHGGASRAHRRVGRPASLESGPALDVAAKQANARDPLPGEAGDSPAHHRPLTPATARDALLRLLRSLEALVRQHDRGHCHRRSTETVCVNASLLALVRVGRDVQLVVARDDRVSCAVADTVQVLECWRRALSTGHAPGHNAEDPPDRESVGPPAPCPCHTSPSGSRRTLGDRRESLSLWLARQRALQCLIPDAARDSPSHRQLLRAIASNARRVPRHDRPRLAERVAVCRRLTLAQRGAGAESLLRQLTAAVPVPPAPVGAVERWLDHVATSLGAGVPATNSASQGQLFPVELLAWMEL